MFWREMAFIKVGLSSIVCLGAVFLFGAQREAMASPAPAGMVLFNDTISPLAMKVRRRFRRYRRTHSVARGREDDKQGGPQKASHNKEVEASLPPLPPSQTVSQATNAVQPPIEVRKDKAPAPSKPSEPQGPPPPPETWTDAEVKAGRLDCETRLSGLKVLFDTLDPIREGGCGSPAPIRLKGFDNGSAPSLSFSPAPTISCKMTAALKRWFDVAVQPSAKAHLNATIVQMTNLSAYSCRMRYDLATQRISQHGYANAIDLGEFITAKGEHVSVLDNWNSGDERAAFLHEIHDRACEIFGTTLGPAANEAHKNHFHLDMTERRRPLCDFTPAQVRAQEEAKKREVAIASAAAKINDRSDDKLVDKKVTDKSGEPKTEAAFAPPTPAPEAVSDGSPRAEPNHRRRRHSHRYSRFRRLR